MRPVLALKTLKAINDALELDQGASYRQLLGKVMPHMDDAYRGSDSPFRTHMGASIIGGECGRAIWYGWRWAKVPKFEGRILRLFNRGHLEEGRFIALLLMIGVEVYQQDEHGKQFRIDHAEGHFGGSGDGVAVGVPDLPHGTAALLEFKTHGEKSFKDLAANGVKESKFEHYVQMNVYMYKMGLAAGLYSAVNKNTDEIHMEIITLDSVTAQQFLDRGEKIIYLQEPPSKLNESPGFWKCRFCDYRNLCHSLKCEEAAVNCRTCQYSRPAKAAKWFCDKYQCELDKDAQMAACSSYIRHKSI